MDLDAVIANADRFCPSWAPIEHPGDEAYAAALGCHVTDGCPEPMADEATARWFAATVIMGVAADEDGYPAAGAEAEAVRVGRGIGVLLVTNRRVAAVLTEGSFLDDDIPALVLSFDRTDIAEVTPETRRSAFGSSTRALSLELHGSSWGVVGIVVNGELDRSPGDVGAKVRRTDAAGLVALLLPTDPSPA